MTKHLLFALFCTLAGLSAAEPVPPLVLTQGWEVAYGVAADAKPTAWVDLAASRSRAGQLAAPRQPNLPLQVRLQLPAVTGTGPWVLAVGNRRTFERAWIDDVELSDIGTRPVVETGMNDAAAKAWKPGEQPAYTLANKYGRSIWEWWRADGEARWLIPAGAVKSGSILRLSGFDLDWNDGLLGQVELRAPHLDDALVPYLWTRPTGAWSNEGIITMSQLVPLSGAITVDIVAQDWFGTELWREQRTVPAAAAATQHTLFVTARGRDEHRAQVTISQGGRSLPVQSLYFALPDRQRGTHRQLMLPEFAWEQRDLPQGELRADGSAVLPPPADGWKPGRIFATNWEGKRDTHRGYLRQTFKLPADAVGRAILRIDQLYYRAEVILNGTRLGLAEWHRLPARFDLTAALRRDGQNELVLVWQDWTAYIRPGIAIPADGVGEPPRGALLAGYIHTRKPFGIGATAIELVPDLRLTEVRADPDHQTQVMQLTATIRNDGTTPVTTTVAASVADRKAEAAGIAIPAGGEVQAVLRLKTTDLGRWSPWTPTLHPLIATLKTANGVADVRQDRIGLRNLGIAGDQLVLDGKPLHLFGGAGTYPGWMNWTTDASSYAAYLSAMRAVGFTNQRNGGEGGQASPLVFEIADEIGIFSRLPSDMDDMQTGFIAYSDPQMHENHELQLKHRGREYWNHPSFAFYDNGNEVLYERTGVAELPTLMQRTEERLVASDLHRLVLHNGSYHPDFKPRIDTSHYFNDRAMGVSHNWLRFDGNLPEQLPDSVRLRHGLESSRVRTHPHFCGEFIWQVNEQELWQGVQSVGELVCKPFGWWKDATHSLGASYLMWDASRVAFARYRASGMVGGDLLWWPLNSLPEGNTEPVLAEFLDAHVRAFGGTTLRRWILIANDDGRERTVEVVLRADGREVAKRSCTLAQGTNQRPTLEFPLPQVTQPTVVALELEARVDGQRRTLRRQSVTVFPRQEISTPAPVAVLDPQGSLRDVFSGTSFRSVASVADVRESMLILGEDLGTEQLAALAPSLRNFVEKGGNVLVCRQTAGVSGLFDLSGKVRRGPVGRALLLAPGHQALTGLVPDDLADWAPDDLVASVAYDLTPTGTGRLLAGMGTWGTQLYEGSIGRGRFVLCAFELTPRTIRAEPAAGILAQNLLTWLSTPAAQPTPEVVVWSPEAGLMTRALRSDLGLHARYGTASEPLADAGVLVLADWQDSAPDASQAAAAKTLLQRGGTILVYRCGPQMTAWLEHVSGVPCQRSTSIAKRLVKMDFHPLLWGMADTDLGYGEGSWREKSPLNKESSQDAVRDVVIPHGARVLTFPAGLVTLPVGRGQLVIDQTRWTEVDAGNAPLRIQQALLTNIGVTLVPPPPLQAPLLAGLTFAPVDLASVANQTRVDAQKFDGTGFLDWGLDLALQPGRQRLGGVEFMIPPEPAGVRTLIGLRSGKGILAVSPPVMLTELPQSTQPIPVGRTAVAVFALHTSAYPLESIGTPMWEYELRYEGFSKLVPGADYEPYRVVVPVRTGIDVGDWTYGQKKPPVPGVAIGPADAPQWIYVQRIDNPKPTRVIESIVVRSLAVRGAPVVVALSLGSPASNLVQGDLTKLPPFRIVVTAGASAADDNRWSSGGWGGNCWSNDTTGLVGLLAAERSEPARLVLTNTSGKASAQIYSEWKDQPAGALITVHVRYRTQGDGRLMLHLNTENGSLKRVDNDPAEGEQGYLTPASHAWRNFTCRVRVGDAQSARLRVLLQNHGLGTVEVSEVWATAE